jgi:nitronate monooxygenase
MAIFGLIIMGGMLMKIQLYTDLCKLLDIDYPIIQAGMAGKITSPELVAAVSNAGALGMLGAAYMTPDQLDQAIRDVRKLTDKPFGVNLFFFEPSKEKGNITEMQKYLNSFRQELHIPLQGEDDVDYIDQQDALLEVVFDHRVPVLGATFGIPSVETLQKVKMLGIRTTMMVTTVREAVLAENAGIDILIAQGGEAGGHRGTLEVKKGSHGVLIGTMALVPQVVDHTTVPVVAAGGIMDGRGLVASLALGAQGVQLGTRFLLAKEAETHPVYREQLIKATEEDTVITTMFSGRPARGIGNYFIEKTEQQSPDPLPYPWQNQVTQDIRQAAAKQNDSRFMSLWAGQGLRLAVKEERAEDIIIRIIEQAKRMIE